MINIAIITVLYNPSEEHLLHITKFCTTELDKYKIHRIFVDNSNSICSALENSDLHYIFNNGNKGIAHAQNIGILKAKQLNCEYVIFFDQDSVFDFNYVKSIIDEYKRIKIIDRQIAILGPTVVDKETNKTYKTEAELNKSHSKVHTIISSGSVVETSTLDIIGGLEDNLFIDLVDHEWCWRAKSFGYTCYQTTVVSLNHKVGCYNKSILGFPVIISAPFRYYYKYRNFLWMLKRSYVPFSWKITNLLRKIIEFIIIPFITKDMIYVNYIFQGISDGLFKKNK